MSEDLQPGVSPAAADQMGQIQPGHPSVQRYEFSVRVDVGGGRSRPGVKRVFVSFRLHGRHQEAGGSSGRGGEGQGAGEPADPPDVSATGQADALCQQPPQLHHDQGEMCSGRSDLKGVKALGVAVR